MTLSSQELNLGKEMHDWACELYPIARSLTGPGVRATLRFLQGLLPELRIRSVPSGTTAFDWTVPNEWTLRAAYIEGPDGQRVVDVADHTLHIVGYSEPVDCLLTLAQLQPYLHSIPEQPDAIPYITSYYSRRWGFSLADSVRQSLLPGDYHVVIDSDLEPGQLDYGELLIPGESQSEILLSTYICHPSMGNNELSGIVVTAALARELVGRGRGPHGLRILFLPETIGSIVYLSHHLDVMRSRIIAGFVVTCVGDERTFSFLPSRNGNTLADRAATCVLNSVVKNYDRYSFLDRGSDERQYCSPGVDLPVVSIMRSKYGTYPEYHTSLDDLTFITPTGLAGSYSVLLRSIGLIQRNSRYRTLQPCEPQLGRRGLYATLSNRDNAARQRLLLNVVAYADGTLDAIDLALRINAPVDDVIDLAERLITVGVLERLPA